MESLIIESEAAPGIVRLTMNRPAARNALNAAMIESLSAAIARHAALEATRVLLLAAAGTAFCAGADIAEMRAQGGASARENRADALRLAQMLASLRDSPKPSIACVQGPAYGGGLGLAAACDIAIASTTASFRLPEARLGLVPAVISPYVIEAIGPRRARRYFLSGEVIDAPTAKAIGLVHESVAADELAATALALGREIKLGGPQALAAAKNLIAEVGHAAPNAALAVRTADILAQLRAGTEAQEGLAAALARRPPSWCA